MKNHKDNRIHHVSTHNNKGSTAFLFAVIALLASPGVMSSDLDIVKRIDQTLPGYVAISTAPSVSVGIIKNGEVLYAKSFGYADKSRGILATPDTLYGIGSVTKTMTATLAVMLRDEGVVDFSAPVSKYLPSSVTVPTNGQNHPITLSDLLTHTSGLPGDPRNRKNQTIEGLGSFDPTLLDAYQISDLYEALPATDVEKSDDKKWIYSNYGYQLTGHVLERAAGIPFEPLLQQKLLRPLGMTSTSILHEPLTEPRYALPYWQLDRHQRARPAARFGEVAAHGGIASSVRDMLKYAQLQLKTADGKGDPISLTSLQGMRQPTATIYEKDDQRTRPKTMQGVGWRIQSPEGGVTIFEHGGSLDGHTASLWVSPQEQLAIVILSNSDQWAPIVDDIREWLIPILRE